MKFRGLGCEIANPLQFKCLILSIKRILVFFLTSFAFAQGKAAILLPEECVRKRADSITSQALSCLQKREGDGERGGRGSGEVPCHTRCCRPGLHIVVATLRDGGRTDGRCPWKKRYSLDRSYSGRSERSMPMPSVDRPASKILALRKYFRFPHKLLINPCNKS